MPIYNLGPREHTPLCLAKQAEVAKYEQEWPHYCRFCGGYGYTYDPGVYYYPDGSGQPPSYDPCNDCIENDKCPRCANESLYWVINHAIGDYFRCRDCEWTDNPDDATPGHPDLDGCECGMFD